VETYDIAEQHDSADLAQVLDLFKRTRAETLRQLDATDRKLDAALSTLARLDG
jgi:hypothetical protein